MSPDFRDPLDEFDASEEANLDAELDATEVMVREQFGRGLAELVEAPADLASRTVAGVGDALLTRSTLAAALDLLGVGWHTIRYLVTESDTTTPKETDQ